jgi:Flp pilus assembly protein TadB
MPPPSSFYASASRRAFEILHLSPEFRKKENGSASDSMKKALLFSGLGVEPADAAALAYVAALALAAILLPLSLLLILVLSPDFLISLYLLLASAIAPLAILIYLANYPKRAAERQRVLSLGRMPEAVNYMAMSMRVTPSLDRAVGFAADNTGGPLSASLRKVLWEVYMRRHSSIEEAFLAFAHDWGEWNDDFKRALHAVRAAEMERTKDGLQRSLDKALDIALSGAKRRMETFAHSLSGPTTVLFSLGILLPMMLGALLPMTSMGGLRLGQWEVALLMDVVFPGATLAFAHSILGKRPGTAEPPRMAPIAKTPFRTSIIVTGLAVGALLILLAAPPLNGMLGDSGPSLSPILLVWGLALPMSVYCLLSASGARKELRRVHRLEDEFPDALFQLGSRIGEGLPVEAAMARTAGTMRNTEVASLFRRISFALRITRASLEEVLFGPKGILLRHPSRTVQASMKMVVESVRKDPVTAGHTIVGISHYLKDLRKVDHDIRMQLSSIMDTMRATAMLFAPLVMGITAALYITLSDVTQGLSIGGTAFGLNSAMRQSISAPVFVSIIGIYLLLTVIILMYFTSGMRQGGDPVERKWDIGTALPVAMALFTVSTLLGGAMMG